MVSEWGTATGSREEIGFLAKKLVYPPALTGDKGLCRSWSISRRQSY